MEAMVYRLVDMNLSRGLNLYFITSPGPLFCNTSQSAAELLLSRTAAYKRLKS